jgi:hypothetical protein
VKLISTLHPFSSLTNKPIFVDEMFAKMTFNAPAFASTIYDILVISGGTTGLALASQ